MNKLQRAILYYFRTKCGNCKENAEYMEVSEVIKQ